MVINHNMGSINANRQIGANSANANKSMEKLSSGLRINRAGDDAAGLAISEKMRGQIRGLDQASANSQDAISLIQTAEGALNETHSILQRMRELSVQSSNDTNTSADRDAIQKEVNQLVSEIDRIGNTTQFNTKGLLNGGAGIQGNTTNAKVVIAGGSISVKAGGSLEIDAVKAAGAGTVSYTDSGNQIDLQAGTFSINGVSISIDGTENSAQFLQKINSVSASTGVTATATGAFGAAGSYNLTFTTNGTGSSSKIDISGIQNVLDANTALQADKNGAGAAASTGTDSITGTDASATIDAANTTGVDPSSITASGNKLTVHGGDYDGLEININSTLGTAGVNNIKVNITANNVLTMQIGANESQTMSVGINDMRAGALFIDNLDLKTQTGASSAITTVNNAIESVSSERSKLGAYQNRLEHTIANLGTSSENLTSAESRIRDVNMAKEMSTFSKNNILSQAAQAMLAQANQQPQQVLQLLR